MTEPINSEVKPEDIVDDDQDQDQDKKGGVRQKITDLEGEREGLRAQLAAAHAQTFDTIAESLNLKPALIRAAGLDISEYVREDGSVDTEALTVAADAKRAELGLPRKPLPNTVAGRGEGRTPPERRSLGDVLREVSRPL